MAKKNVAPAMDAGELFSTQHGEDEQVLLDEASKPGEVFGLLQEPQAAGYEILASDGASQQALFPAGELLTPPALAKFRKGIALLHSAPVSRDQNHTLNSRRIMDAIVALVQIEFKRMPKAVVEKMREYEASPMFYVSKGELRKMAGIGTKNYEEIEKILDRLHEMPLRWNILGEDSSTEWDMKSRFLSTYGIGKGSKQGMVCFAIDPRVLSLILEPKFWVTLQFEITPHLRLEAAYTLYQHAWRYIGTFNKVTADFPVTTWIELLIGNSRHVKVDPKTGEKSVVDYSDFKRRYLLPALARINSISALGHTIELREHRSGLKVKRLQFKFVAKRQESLELPMSWPEAIIETLKQIGFTEDEVATLGQGFSLDDVIESLARFRQAQERKAKQGERIGSPTSFFNGVLTNVANQAVLDAEKFAEIEKVAKAEEVEKLRKQREERALVEFNLRRHKIFKAALLAWPEDRRTNFFKEFEGSQDFRSATRTMIAKGWESAGMSAWVELREWAAKRRPSDWAELLPNPEDQNLDAWLLWRLDQAGQTPADA
ncbi:MAG: RepB family plasmid replication initiator protein [Roseateles sp.]|nr:MAG: RepB family plasmid replication initiator protein [Roseateles sp.]